MALAPDKWPSFQSNTLVSRRQVYAVLSMTKGKGFDSVTCARSVPASPQPTSQQAKSFVLLKQAPQKPLDTGTKKNPQKIDRSYIISQVLRQPRIERGAHRDRGVAETR
ncbi:hypothetical protein CONLIGDRAFT_627083 [Coniochaeta ligniaria NRRL 30616]|uniref:Uncharacterized protein n=1 Tax=Coniochaeta ligniaria NRRL 30616 TaxID=1408157 RepID=A0A1J7JY37_9PEZI|nr:hypothetical protein CONLIGDRAFT_627083 [Coniochaeta ligniaria NRRL 30616]